MAFYTVFLELQQQADSHRKNTILEKIAPLLDKFCMTSDFSCLSGVFELYLEALMKGKGEVLKDFCARECS